MSQDNKGFGKKPIPSKIVNLACRRIKEYHKAEEFLLSNNTTSDRTVNFQQTISKNFSYIDRQARIFRDNYLSHGEINHYKIFRCRQEEVGDLVYMMFVYSYAKAMYAALFYHNFHEDSNFGRCLKGHSQMFHLLKSPNYQEVIDGFFVNNTIHLGDEDSRKVFIALLFKQFPKLGSNIVSQDNFGFQPLIITKYEYLFDFLVDDYYAKSADPEEKSAEADDIRGRGRIQIVPVNEPNCMAITSNDSYPCLNAFYSNNEKKLICYSVHSDHKMQDNNSLWLPKAIGLKLNDSQSESVVDKCGFISISNNNSLDHISCSEVYAISGIRCKYITSSKSRKPFFDPIEIDLDPLIEKLIKYISEKEGLKMIVTDLLKSLPEVLEPEGVGVDNKKGK